MRPHQPSLMRCVSLCLAALLLSPAHAAPVAASADWSGRLSTAVELRQQGNVLQSIDLLISARDSAPDAQAQQQASGELGVSLMLAHRYGDARPLLSQAHEHFTGADRARYAVYLGNLEVSSKHLKEAGEFYHEAQALAGEHADIGFSASLDLARIAPAADRLQQLQALARQLDTATGLSIGDLARFRLNLGNQARLLGLSLKTGGSNAALALAYRQLELARQHATGRTLVEVIDTLAQLYEDQGRVRDAANLNEQALTLARSQDAGAVADLLISLNWRQGRLLKAKGDMGAALAAYQRAVNQIEMVRQDIPIDYDDGRSSFHDTLEPIYLGYADLLLQQSDHQTPALAASQLEQVRNTIELIRQTEMQDFLGDRCTVAAAQGGEQRKLQDGTAVMYPLIFPDRIELLLQTSTGLVRRTSKIGSAQLRNTAGAFSEKLRNGLDGYETESRQLYDWLLRPFDGIVAEQHIHNLVVVPDGILRLVPIGALLDDDQYAIEKYGVSMVTGLSMTNTAAPSNRHIAAMVAGVSSPGPVVEKLAPLLDASIVEAAHSEAGNSVATSSGSRSLKRLANTRAIAPAQEGDGKDSKDSNSRALDKLRKRLELPGAASEVSALEGILRGTDMLNGDFTVSKFSDKLESGDYGIVHIASHGVFGGSAESSFIMAYDDVINMNNLQSLLQTEQSRKAPIELLSLSACETAEGNDRSPLGISGAAIKAHAKSVLGTIWPVDDNAAHLIMVGVYTGLVNNKLSKTEALRQAQIDMLHNSDTAHPFYWAPFVLIGNWL